MGPVVSGTALDEVLEAIDRGRREGGTVVAGGARGHDQAFLIEPMVFEAVADDAYLSCEEVFGPVTSLYRFSDLDEAIQRANGVPFGLSSGIFTRDLHVVQRLTQEMQAGRVHMSSKTPGADVHVPSGGIKDSGGARTSRSAPRWRSSPRPSPSTRMPRSTDSSSLAGMSGRVDRVGD